MSLPNETSPNDAISLNADPASLASDSIPALPTVAAPPLGDTMPDLAMPDWVLPDDAGNVVLPSECMSPIPLAKFLALPMRPRELLLAPIIPEKGLAMLYGARGTGKTYVAHGIAHAVATGSSFLKWQAEKPRRVLLVDGEMPAQALRERLSQVAGPEGATAPYAIGTVPQGDAALEIIASDLLDNGVGNLASAPVQARLELWLGGFDLLILDNLSSLTAALHENDGDAWSCFQQWLLRLRRRGVSVLIVHHAGKGGEQRGTSRREDALDTTINLRRPYDYVPSEGARFEVHIEKGRTLYGADARSFEARLAIVDGRTDWTVNTVDDIEAARVAAMLEAGLSIRDIAEETGMHRSRVHRIKQRMEGEGAGQW
jgi:putative DNA primase/helicase